MVQAGTPDILGCYKGFSFAIECKVGNNKTTKKQDEQLGQWLDARCKAIVAYSIEDVEGMIADLEKLHKHCYFDEGRIR